MANKGPGPVPNRWLRCPRKSDHFIAEKFLAFKTPLSERFKDQLPLDCMFPPEMIFGYMNTLKIKLGLWIDLTNTNRFYSREVVESKGCQYVKLQCRGHEETPSREQTASFIEIVENFINERPFDIIGVHCTHGFNRTGFLIVSYMVEKLDCSVEAALTAFARARPPGIYKEDYIQELFRRYDEEEDPPPPPALPDWCFDYDDSDGKQNSHKRAYEDDHAGGSQDVDDENDIISNNTQNGEESTGEPSRKKRKREMVKKDAKFMEGICGVTLVIDQPRLSELQAMVQDMCKWPSTGFPGSQPVSMDMMNIQKLHDKPYRVSWKADGTRYMMLINKRDEIYFFDRDFSCFEVEGMTFPRPGDIQRHLTNTLLDGEMVIDKVNGTNIPRYLVYDIICFENDNNVAALSFFPERLDYIKRKVVEPRYQAVRQGLIDRSSEPFSVRNKDFWDITQAAALLGQKFAKMLCHEPDGLIFQPSKQPYTPGESPDVLKWKPLSLNSVDFKLLITKESGTGVLSRKIGLLYVGGLDVPYAQIKYTKALKDMDKKIIECKLENKQWVFMRERVDKSFPNSFKTAQAVIESIKNPVTTEILLNFIKMHRYDDNKIMPPPPQRRSPPA